MTTDYPTWPGWETKRLIGSGGCGSVYEIQRNIYGTQELAAMKVITVPKDSNEIDAFRYNGYDESSIRTTIKDRVQSIAGEYLLMKQLNGNVNVVNCYDYKEEIRDDGYTTDIYVRMELLTPVIEALPQRPSESDCVKLGIDICKALMLCEEKNIVHRDIKPANIFRAPTGAYKLGDFGVSKVMEVTTGGTITGTPDYMAPEVYKGKNYNHTVDIYSLGIVLYWVLNERRTPFLPLPPTTPLAQNKEKAIIRRVSGEPLPPPAHGSEALKEVILKACAYHPKDRYQSAEEFLNALLSIPIENGKGPGDDTIIEKKLQKDSKFGNQTIFICMAGVILALIILVVFLLRDITSPTACTHVWNAATCTESKTCSLCGETEGEPLGHTWIDATCTEPMTCTACGKTEGTPLGHIWHDATCTEPKTCVACGATEGEPLGHNWIEATYETPKTCTVCGFTEGAPLEDKYNNAAVGDIVTFGKYEQDNNISNGQENIEWIVLAKEDNRMLLISNKALDCQQYSSTDADIKWQTCTLRYWLNETFLNAAFDSNDQAIIELINVLAGRNPQYSTNPGGTTTDKVFLLSIEEMNKYFSSDESRKCVPTAYAIAQGAYTSTSSTKDGVATCWWWLRSPGYSQTYAANVNSFGSVYCTGRYVCNIFGCVRPAIWISLNS